MLDSVNDTPLDIDFSSCKTPEALARLSSQWFELGEGDLGVRFLCASPLQGGVTCLQFTHHVESMAHPLAGICLEQKEGGIALAVDFVCPSRQAGALEVECCDVCHFRIPARPLKKKTRDGGDVEEEFSGYPDRTGFS